MMEGDSFRMAWNEACLQAGLPSISLDTAARILAVLHVESGCTTAVTFSPKLRADLKYIYTGSRGACGPVEALRAKALLVCLSVEALRGLGMYLCRGVSHTPSRRPDRDGHRTYLFGPTGAV